MKKVVIITVIAISSFQLMSCGTGKQLTAANTKIEQLNSQVSGLNTKVSEDEKMISHLKTENTQYGKEAEDCRKTKEEIAQRLENLNKNLAEQGTSLKQIRQKTEEAISKFEDQGATVTYKNGLIHINFEDRFFFKSGSSTVGIKGREALNTVAKVMRENPGITAIIVGNTDTTHVKGTADNWSLSTERANAVVRVLDQSYYINPARLTAAGRGKYNPVASNDTEEGRTKNRRIEIILNPDFSRLWDLMDQ
jgi:chemotaxis protein MotB